MSEFERVAVLVQRNRHDIDPRKDCVDPPWIVCPIGAGIPEGIVVVDLVQGCGEIVVAVDIGRSAVLVGEDERNREGQDPPPAAQTADGLKVGARKPPGETAADGSG